VEVVIPPLHHGTQPLAPSQPLRLATVERYWLCSQCACLKASSTQSAPGHRERSPTNSWPHGP
jgi:hypothetical protein